MRQSMFKRFANIHCSKMKDLEAKHGAQWSKHVEAYSDYLQAKVMYHEYSILCLKHEKRLARSLEPSRRKLIQHHQEKLNETLKALHRHQRERPHGTSMFISLSQIAQYA